MQYSLGDMDKRKSAVAVFILAMIFFLAGLSTLEFIKIDCRFGQFVKEMHHYGVSVFPTLYGKFYTDYPSTHTIMMYLVSCITGKVDLFSCTLPSATAAALTLLFTFLTGALISRRLGLYAVIMSYFAYEFFSLARNPAPDHFVCLAAVAAFYCVFSGEFSNKKFLKRIFFVPLCMALGFAVRGPIGAVIPTAVVFSYFMVARRWKGAIISCLCGGIVLALGCAVFIYLCKIQCGNELAKEFIASQLLNRVAKVQPFYFYFANGFGGYTLTYGMAVVVFALYIWHKRLFVKSESQCSLRLLQYCGAWALIILLGMSIPGTKHVRYVMAFVPAISLACGYFFMNFDKIKEIEFLQKIFIVVASLAPPVILAGLWITALVIRIINLDFAMPLLIPSILLLVCCASLYAIWWQLEVSKSERQFLVMCVLLVAFAGIKIMVIDAAEQYHESSRLFVAACERELSGNKTLYFYDIGPDKEDVKYAVNTKRIFTPRFITENDYPALLAVPPQSLVILRQRDFKRFSAEIKSRCRIAARGKLGHRKCFAVHIKEKAK